MGKISVAALTLVVAVLVAAAAFGPGPTPGASSGSASALLHSAAVSAATITPYRDPSGGFTVIDQNQTATPTPAATQSVAVSPQSLIRTVRLTPFNDASVASGGLWQPNQNLGGWSTLRVGPAGGGFFRSYVRFLTSGLPAGMQIDSALLILTPSDGGGAAAVPLEADYVLDPWDQATINWNQQPLATYQAGTATWQPGGSGLLSMDVTPAVQQWYACGSTANNGLLLSADLAGNYADFASSKSDSPPVLQITYQTAVAPANCAAPPTNNVNLTAPTGVSPSTSGAQIGAQSIVTPFNPNPRPVAPGAAGGSTSSNPSGGNTGVASGSNVP